MDPGRRREALPAAPDDHFEALDQVRAEEGEGDRARTPGEVEVRHSDLQPQLSGQRGTERVHRRVRGEIAAHVQHVRLRGVRRVGVEGDHEALLPPFLRHGGVGDDGSAIGVGFELDPLVPSAREGTAAGGRSVGLFAISRGVRGGGRRGKRGGLADRGRRRRERGRCFGVPPETETGGAQPVPDGRAGEPGHGEDGQAAQHPQREGRTARPRLRQASTTPSRGHVSHRPRVKSGKSTGRLRSATDSSLTAHTAESAAASYTFMSVGSPSRRHLMSR